jgi:adenosylhomocysteine nucleosidase
MRILVTFALGEEFGGWRRQGGFRASGGEECRAHRKRKEGLEVVALETGVGPENARRAVAAALEAEAFDLVISSGLAGGLRPEHRPGTVLTARAVRRLEDGRELAPAAEWAERAEELGARAATFVTAASVAGTAEEKRRLGAAADAVEMETFAVVEEATRRGIAAAAIRVVGDPVEQELPLDFSRVFDERGKLRAVPLAGALVRRPAAIAGLARLARESRRASAVLGEFLERYVNAAAVAGRGEPVGSQTGR